MKCRTSPNLSWLINSKLYSSYKYFKKKSVYTFLPDYYEINVILILLILDINSWTGRD